MRSGRRKAAKDVKQEEEVSKEVAEAPAPAPASAPAAAPLPPKEEPPPTAGGGGRERDRGRKRAREAEESAPPVICPIALVAGHPSAGAGFNDGHPTAAQFRGPMGIALAPSGHLLVCDSDNRRLRRLVPLVTQTGPPAPPAAPGDENRAGMRGGGDDGVAVVPGAFAKVGTLAGSSRPGTHEITRDHPRLPEITRDHPSRPGTHDGAAPLAHSSAPCSTHLHSSQTGPRREAPSSSPANE